MTEPDSEINIGIILSSVELLSEIFKSIPFNEKLLTLPLVCKQFHDTLKNQHGIHYHDCQVDGFNFPNDIKITDNLWPRLLISPAILPSLRHLHLSNLRSPSLPSNPNPPTTSMTTALSLCPNLISLVIARSAVHVIPCASSLLSSLSSNPFPHLVNLDLTLAGPINFDIINSLAINLPLLQHLSISIIRSPPLFPSLENNNNNNNTRHPGFYGTHFPHHLTTLSNLQTLVLDNPTFSTHINNNGGGEGEGEVPSGLVNIHLPEDLSTWVNSLTRLELMGLGLRSLPEALGDLYNLKVLQLGRNALGGGTIEGEEWGEGDYNTREEGCRALGRLNNLKTLGLEYNGFETWLPACIGDLANGNANGNNTRGSLEDLDIGGNMFGATMYDLPPSWRNMTQLVILRMTYCALKIIPPVVQNYMTGLLALKVNINELTGIPDGPYLHELLVLDLGHNRIQPEDMDMDVGVVAGVLRKYPLLGWL